MRLLPRFSLRFVWIALTIFLLGFGFWHNYLKRESEHREIVARFKASGWNVEEETDTLLGFLAVHRLVGLTAEPRWNDVAKIGPFLDLPRPWDLRRLRCHGFAGQGAPWDAEQLSAFTAMLQRCSELERLQLHDVRFAENQTACLSTFHQLQLLDLQGCTLPRGALARLLAQPRLDLLLLTLNTENADEVYRLDCPQLRVLYLTDSQGNDYSLTHDGFGRFPQLVSLITEDCSFEQVRCEAGAMPCLKKLSLDMQLRPQLIDWVKLPDAAPELEEVSLYWMHFRQGTDESLRRWKKLRQVHLEVVHIAGDISKILREVLLVYQDGSVSWDHPRLFKEWQERNPAVKFQDDSLNWRHGVLPANYPLSSGKPRFEEIEPFDLPLSMDLLSPLD